jgi:hypothetical protein
MLYMQRFAIGRVAAQLAARLAVSAVLGGHLLLRSHAAARNSEQQA